MPLNRLPIGLAPPKPVKYDELRGSAAATLTMPLTEHWREFFTQLAGEGFASLDKRVEALRRPS